MSNMVSMTYMMAGVDAAAKPNNPVGVPKDPSCFESLDRMNR